MFYVSSISGNLTPFDPSTGTIARASQVVAPVVQATSPGAVSALQSSTETSSIPAAATTVSVTEPTTGLTQNQEAAVYDGEVIPTSRERIAASDLLNTGRAGAVMAYRVQESGLGTPVPHASVLNSVGTVQPTNKVDDDSGMPRHRVNPIKQSNYRRQTPIDQRKQVVVAADIMSSPVFSLKAALTIDYAQRVFKEHKFRHIPIVSETGKLIGIVSDRDFIGTQPHTAAHAVLIKERMTINILTARPQTEIRAIAEVMINHHIGCLPIIDQEASLVGIITRSDILRAIVNHAPIELWT